jgi:hypothetical protein
LASAAGHPESGKECITVTEISVVVLLRDFGFVSTVRKEVGVSEELVLGFARDYCLTLVHKTFWTIFLNFIG